MTTTLSFFEVFAYFAVLALIEMSSTDEKFVMILDAIFLLNSNRKRHHVSDLD